MLRYGPVGKNLPAVRLPGLIPGLGRSPEKEMATHSGILAWEIPRIEEAVGHSTWGCKRVRLNNNNNNKTNT